MSEEAPTPPPEVSQSIDEGLHQHGPEPKEPAPINHGSHSYMGLGRKEDDGGESTREIPSPTNAHNELFTFLKTETPLSNKDIAKMIVSSKMMEAIAAAREASPDGKPDIGSALTIAGSLLEAGRDAELSADELQGAYRGLFSTSDELKEKYPGIFSTKIESSPTQQTPPPDELATPEQQTQEAPSTPEASAESTGPLEQPNTPPETPNPEPPKPSQ